MPSANGSDGIMKQRRTIGVDREMMLVCDRVKRLTHYNTKHLNAVEAK